MSCTSLKVRSNLYLVTMETTSYEKGEACKNVVFIVTGYAIHTKSPGTPQSSISVRYITNVHTVLIKITLPLKRVQFAIGSSSSASTRASTR